MTSQRTGSHALAWARHFWLIVFAVALSAALGGCSSSLGTAPDASMEDAPSGGPVGKTMTANSSKFVGCARDSVAIQTGTTERIELNFKIDGSGKVRQAAIERMSEPDPDLYTCVLRALRKIEFPKPSDGKEKEIHYPLVLKPS